MSRRTITRREGLSACAALLAGSRALAQMPDSPIPPLDETVNVLEFEAAAKARLTGLAYSEIAGSDRAAFDRITFRPRLMVDTRELNLAVDLFGSRLFAPILVGPVASLDGYHPEGELALVRGATAGKAAVVVADRSSHPIERIAAQSDATLWRQVALEGDLAAVTQRAKQAVNAGCKALCLIFAGSAQPLDWTAVDRVRQAVSIPLLLKGIMSPEDAQTAVTHGVQGVVVSSYRGRITPDLAAPVDVLPSIVEAVGTNVPVLVDGSFRRGSDVLKALALGARAVLLARPAVWGLAAYGPEGVQRVLELVQSELARDMAMCGKPNLAAIDRSVIKVHRR